MDKTFAPIKILNVDDNEVSRYTKSHTLRLAGFEVKEAATGHQALQLLPQVQPALVLLDVHLPDISGLEVCRRIKSDPALAQTLVLQISASLITSTERTWGLESGADAYLTEPIEPAELIANVRALLRIRQVESALETQRAFLRQVIDLNPNLIFAKDRQGRFTLANEAVAKVYGTTVENLVGKTDADFNPDQAEVEHFQRDDLEVMDTLQEKIISEERLTDAAGQVRWLQTVKRPLLNQEGVADQILGVATDITPLKQTQADLISLNESLEERVVKRTALLQLLHEITTAANEAETMESALQFVLDRICAYTGWPVGHVYLPSPEDARQLIPTQIWCLQEPERFEPFRQATETTPMPAGSGLPGRVLERAEPIWITEVSQDWHTARREAARQSGLKTGLGFPVWVGREIVAVLEFFTPEIVEPTRAFTEAMTNIGNQLGRVVERKRAEVRLRESQRQLVQAEQIAHLGSWQWDIAANQVSWSDEMYRIYGLAPQSVEITYEDFLARVHPNDRDQVTAVVSAASQNGQPFDYEHRIIRPDGSLRVLYAQGRVIMDELGRAQRMIGAGYDITERKQMEEQLRHLNVELEQRVSQRTAALEQVNTELETVIDELQQAEAALSAREKQMRLITDAVPVLIAYVDAEQCYRFNNQAYESWFGLSPAKLYGRHLKEALGEAAYEVLRPHLEAALSGQEVTFESLVPYQSGEKRYIHAHYVPDVDESGQIKGFVSLVSDITDRKRAELRQSLLAEAGKILASSLDPAEQLANIARLAVPQLADWCAVTVFEADWTVRYSAVAHVDPAKVALAAEMQQRWPAQPEVLARLAQPWQHGQSELYPEITEAMLEAGAQDAEHYQAMLALDLRSAIVAPLVARERVLGFILLVWAESGHRYDQQDLALAEELARRAAIGLDNAQVYAAEQQARELAEATAERVASLQEATAALSRALTPGEIVKVILDQSMAVLEANGGAVMQLNEAGDSLEIVQAMGLAETSIEAFRCFPVEAPIPASEAVRTQQPIWLESRQAFEERYPHLAAIRSAGALTEGVGVVPLMVEGRTLGALAVSFDEPHAFKVEDQDFLETLAGLCAQALERARLYEVEQQARAEAEANQQRLALLAEMRERNRLAQELHDTVAQALGYLNLKIATTNSLLENGQLDKARNNLRELKAVIGETYTDVREEIFNLRAKIVSGMSFLEVLDRYIDKYQRFYNLSIQLVVEADTALFQFPPEVTPQVIRTIQEALINVRKHARVNQAVIRLGEENGRIRISVEDQGDGFDLSQAKEKTGSFGLQIMRERVQSIGGNLEIESSPGQGAQVILWYQKPYREIN